MRSWIKRTFLGVLGATILAGGLAACAHQHGPWNEADSAKMREHVLARVGKELALDDAQKQRLVVLADKLKDERAALAGPGNDPRAEFQALLAGPKLERDKAQSLVDSKTAVLRSKSPEVITAAGDFFDSLRPDQQQKVRDFLANHHGRHG